MSTPQAAPTKLGDILRHVGPGLILTASIVGSGEVIATPKLAAEAGFQLLWLIVLGCVIKVFVQVELGRFAVANGMTTLEAMDTIPGPRLVVSWLLWLWFLMYVAIVFQVAGIVGGIADVLVAAGSNVDRKVLAILIGGGTAGLLVLGRYRLVERVSIAMVAAFTLCTVIAVGSLQWSDFAITGAQLAEGFKFQLPDNFTTAFGAFGIIGVGASELIYYPYWVLEKGYARHVGPNDHSEAWYARARGWMRVMRVDAWVSMVVYTLATVAFFLLGAAVLNAKGLAVSDKGMIDTLAHMYKASFGQGSFVVFLVGAFFALFSTAFVATASNARLLADGLTLFKVCRYPDEEARQRMIKNCCVLLPAISVGMFMVWEKPVTLVFIGAVGQGLMLPFLAMAALYFRYQRTDKPLQPGAAWTFFLWVAAAAMIAAGIYQVRSEFKPRPAAAVPAPTAAQLAEFVQHARITLPASAMATGWKEVRGMDDGLWLRVTLPAAEVPAFIATSPFQDRPLKSPAPYQLNLFKDFWKTPPNRYRAGQVEVSVARALNLLVDETDPVTTTLHLMWHEM